MKAETSHRALHQKVEPLEMASKDVENGDADPVKGKDDWTSVVLLSGVFFRVFSPRSWNARSQKTFLTDLTVPLSQNGMKLLDMR